MHIGDFKFPREEFKVWCRHHAKKAPKEAVMFVGRRGFKCAILGPEVGGDGLNYPNDGYAVEAKR